MKSAKPKQKLSHGMIERPKKPVPVKSPNALLNPKALHHYFKSKSKSPAPRTGNEVPFTIPNLCAAYNWPGINGKPVAPGGGIIAIVELGGGWLQSDMTTFFQSIGQPLPSIVDVSVDGTKNTPGNDADVEVALDIQVAAAAYYVATGKPATIRVYWSADIATAVAKAEADGCDVCSISWGADEANWGALACRAMDQAAAKAANAGMVTFAASGDNDASDGGGTPANVDCPSSCPHIIGCGGTTKTSNSEIVWNNDPNPNDPTGEGSGGGFSTVFPVQSFQVGTPNPPQGLGRMVPDCAANADPNTGYEIFVHGGWQTIGGTSAVAPLYAGLFASFGKKLGFVTPYFYSNLAEFTDVTQGGNGLYLAGTGPDPCTGVGAPIGFKLAALFEQVPAPSPNPIPTPNPPGQGTITLAQALDAVKRVSAGFPLIETSKVNSVLASLPGWSS